MSADQARQRAVYELEEAARFVGVDPRERRVIGGSLAGALALHAVLLWAQMPDWGPAPVRVQAPGQLMQVQFLKPQPPAAQPKPAPPKQKAIPRPDPNPSQPEPEAAPAPAAAPESAAGPVRVATGQGPGLIKRVEPRYPDIARMAKIEGTVVLDAVILQDGTVDEIEVLRTDHPSFTQSAIDALKQWRFTPGDHDVIMTLTVNYVLK